MMKQVMNKMSGRQCGAERDKIKEERNQATVTRGVI